MVNSVAEPAEKVPSSKSTAIAAIPIHLNCFFMVSLSLLRRLLSAAMPGGRQDIETGYDDACCAPSQAIPSEPKQCTAVSGQLMQSASPGV